MCYCVAYFWKFKKVNKTTTSSEQSIRINSCLRCQKYRKMCCSTDFQNHVDVKVLLNDSLFRAILFTRLSGFWAQQRFVVANKNILYFGN